MAASVPLAPMLSQEELDQLTPEELTKLREEIQKEIRTNGQIQSALRDKARQMYNQMRPKP